MLKQRLIAALVLIPLVVWGVLTLSTPVFAALVGVILVLGAWEWSRLIPLSVAALQIGFALVAAVLVYAVWASGMYQERLLVILAAGVLWWILAFIWLGYANWSRNRHLVKALIALPALIPAWLALITLHGWSAQGGYWVLYILVMIWIADSAAYFTGKALGRHKLAPSISPGKTWEGVAGGMAACTAFAGGVSFVPGWTGWQQFAFLVLSLVTVGVSIVGDLFVSALKRQVGIKDTSNLIPGHGGVLDRIDSLLAAAPVFVFGLLYLGMMPQ